MAVQRLPKIQRSGRELRLAGFIDVETTGLSAARDEVVEFAIVLFAFDPVTGDIAGIVDEYVGLRDPGRPIPKAATAVHGICDADVRGKRLDDGRIRSLIDRAEFLIAHNARFDRAFVERLFPSARKKKWHCSMNGVPWKKLGFTSKGLHNLLADHHIHIERAHRGLDDVLGALALLASVDSSGNCYFKYIVEQHAASVTALARTGGSSARGRSLASSPEPGAHGRAGEASEVLESGRLPGAQRFRETSQLEQSLVPGEAPQPTARYPARNGDLSKSDGRSQVASELAASERSKADETQSLKQRLRSVTLSVKALLGRFGRKGKV